MQINFKKLYFSLAVFLLLIPNRGYADTKPISLTSGVNVIGCPLTPTAGYSAYDMLNQLGSGYVTTVSRYDNSTGQWQDAYWFFGQPAGTDFAINVGEGYCVECSNNCTLNFSGTSIGTFNYTLDLLSGYNVFSVPNPTGYTGYDLMVSLQEENVYALWQCVNEDWQWALYWDNGVLHYNDLNQNQTLDDEEKLYFDPNAGYLIQMYNTITDWSPVKIQVAAILFNHDTSSTSSEGVTIRKNLSNVYGLPEWYKSISRNDPCCYKKSTSITIKAVFSVTPAIVTSARLRAESIDYDGSLGDVEEAVVNFSSGISGYVQFDIDGYTPSTIQITDTDQWQWYFRDINGGGLAERTSDITGPHKVYTILGDPEDPWTTTFGQGNIPWTDVLDYSCVWADGRSQDSDVVEDIAMGIYDELGLVYDTQNGAPSFTGSTTQSFNLTDFLNAAPSIGPCNCYDCGKALKIFANIAGCSLNYQLSHVSDTYCFGYLNCVKPVGCGWTNNPFYDSGLPVSPEHIVPEDYTSYYYPPYGIVYRSSFGRHAFCALGTQYYDATMKVDTDGNPDYSPHAETWAFDWSWTSYKSNVIDNNPAPPCYNGTGPAVTYSFWIY